MKNKKILSLVISALTLVGCGGTGNSGAANNGDPILVWVGAESVDFYKAKLEEYKTANPSLNLSFEVKGVDTGTAATTFLADTEAGADIFTVAHNNVADLTTGASAIMPVTNKDLLAQIQNDNPAAFQELVKSTVGGQEYTFAVPYISQSLVLYYNTAAISTEQVKTWEGIRDAAKAAGSDVKGTTVAATDLFNFSWPYLSSRVDGTATSFKLYENGSLENVEADGDDTVACLKWVQDYFADPNGGKYPTDAKWEQQLAIPQGGTIGKVLSVVGGAWHYESAKAALGDNLGIAVLPTYTITADSAYGTVTAGTVYQSGTFTDCKAFVMKNGSKYARYLDGVVKFLSSKEVQEKSFEVCNNLPAYKNARAEFNSMKADTFEAKLANAQYEMFDHGRPQPFGDSRFNSYFYSSYAAESYKYVIDNPDGAWSTLDAIKAELGVIETIWKTGNK